MPEPTKHFNFIQVTLGVSPIETVAPAAGKPVGTIAFATDTEAFYEVCQTAANAHIWKPLNGASSAGWSKYVVSGQATPVAPYSTVQSAVTAAVADGHNAANPATILILPGNYTEPVTMAPGISLVGLDVPLSGSSVTITGTVTVSLASDGACGFSNVIIAGNLVLGGTHAQTLSLINVGILASAGSAIADTNSGAGTISFFNCSIATTDAAGFAMTASNARTIAAQETSFSGLLANSALSWAGGNPIFRRCDVIGRVVLATAGTATFSESRLRVTGQAAVTAGAGTTASIVRSTLESDGTNVLDGTGTISTNDNTFTNSSAIVATLTTAPFRSIPQVVHSKPAVAANAATFPFGSDVAIVDQSAGIVTITLQPIARYLDGEVITVKSNGSANVVTVKGNAAELIDGANTLALNVSFGLAQLMADRTDGLWRVIAVK